MSGPAQAAVEQPASFAFDGEHGRVAERMIARYPEGRQASAVLPLLDLAQRQHGGWVPRAAIEHIAGRLGMAKIRVMEVATFYTMINLAPVGTFHLQVCGTTPCMVRGVGEVFRAIRDEVGIGPGETSEDGQFTCTEVECLGACVNAPMVQVNDDFVEDLTYENFAAVLRALKKGDDLPAGSQAGRRSSEPEGGALTLLDVSPPVRFDPAAIYGAPSAAAAEAPAEPPAAGAARPPALDAPRGGESDPLTRIKGLGAKIERALHGIGVYHFDQVAAWTPDQSAWVNEALKLGGRIERGDWIAQAAALAEAGEGGA